MSSHAKRQSLSTWAARDGAIPCPTCGKSHPNRESLISHNFAAHGVDLREYGPVCCRVCQLEFEDLPAVLEHHTETGEDHADRAARCQECGDVFEKSPSVPRQYCSPKCESKASEKARVTLNCEQCGDEFKVLPSLDDQQYCSPACKQEASRKRLKKRCPICLGHFETLPSFEQTYCSPECAHDANSDRVDGVKALRSIIFAGVGSPHDRRGFKSLRDGGYQTVEDIVTADPRVIAALEHVGNAALRALTEEVDGFDASEYIWKSEDTSDRPTTTVDNCPACGKELEDGEYLSHILNCDEV